MAAAGGGRGSQPGLASAPGSAGDSSLLGSATVWPLKRYGRFLPPKDGDCEGQNTSWKVFESNEESGPLVLTIVESGHFFISQGRTVLEGFSLIDSHKWLKIVRRAECLLLRAEAKNECRMFRVQFGGSCREEMQEHCCSCVQKLSEYVPVQRAEEQSLSQDTQGMDTEHAVSDHTPPNPNLCLGELGTRSFSQLCLHEIGIGKAVLRQRPELPPACRHPAWSARELGPFIRLCLMDQHFPAFVEDVEKELHRLAQE
ncbi:Meiotic recombination protein REC114 [Lonchura striata]|uniref:Meiotic recombination protein REC114 n=1 Tax=Lonchura striata TaxID=40157 RepID=A0A218UZ07_9PASE|nr:Meiotic recombination protein REC114 [Lonchura striata domestica]